LPFMPTRKQVPADLTGIRRRGRRYQVRVFGGLDPATGRQLILTGSAKTEADAIALRGGYREQIRFAVGGFAPLIQTAIAGPAGTPWLFPALYAVAMCLISAVAVASMRETHKVHLNDLGQRQPRTLSSNRH
jgi:hypothetical protein